MGRIRARRCLAGGRLHDIADNTCPFGGCEARSPNGTNLGDWLPMTSQHDLLAMLSSPDEFSE